MYYVIVYRVKLRKLAVHKHYRAKYRFLSKSPAYAVYSAFKILLFKFIIKQVYQRILIIYKA